MPEDFAVRNTVYNKASGDYYTMIRRGNEYYQRRHQIGFDGKETNVLEERIDYVIGSGDQARSFLHRTSEGKLIELPVTWYSEKNGYWEMTPGYEFANQKDFHGVISKNCIFCHDAYPSALPREIEDSEEPIFPDELPTGIDCQRCHGPGRASTSRRQSRRISTLRVCGRRSSIRQPSAANGSSKCAWSVIFQLAEARTQTLASSSIAGSSLIGQDSHLTITNCILTWPGRKIENGFEIADAAYRLRMSRCFQQSQMTCLTCHDPHHEAHSEKTEAK